jgi:hypothetical protein
MYPLISPEHYSFAYPACFDALGGCVLSSIRNDYGDKLNIHTI